MPTITTRGHADLLQGLGKRTAVVFNHDWPLSADAWEDQLLFLGVRKDNL